MLEPRDARVFDLDQLPQDRPMQRLSRRRIVGDRFMVSEVLLEEGCVVPSHAHENEQLTIVLRGRVRFRIGSEPASDAAGPHTPQPPARELVVGARQAVHFPSQVAHAAEALEDTLVLDIFSPVTLGTGIDQQGEREG